MAANEEASPICRGKNLSWETVMLFFNYMPKEPMAKDRFNAYVEKNISSWTQTHSQIARQLAFYYEENGICYPRFNHASTLTDLFAYMVHWAHNYFIPNPYAPSLKGRVPTSIYAHIIKCMNSGCQDFDTALDSLFDIPLSSHDKVRVYLQNYTNIKFDNGKISINQNIVDKATVLVPSEFEAVNTKAYYMHYSNNDSALNRITQRADILFSIDKSLQQIYYGAPGTGKSHIISDVTKGESVIRTTFHPDSDYSTFVGAYKPTTKEVILRDLSGHPVIEGDVTLSENKIVYEFVGQSFLKAYIQAWKFYAEEDGEKEPKKQFLVIEEINRGNCAQIFGDLFQLLDRNNAGFSDYPINADNDMKKQLAKAFKGLSIASAESINAQYNSKDMVSKVLSGEILLLPNNLYIWATMNTSDQSLFPIDSAFKRRWEWKYMKIKEGKDENGNSLDWKIVVKDADGNNRQINGEDSLSWWTFIQKINDIIASMTSSADKQLGYFFCKAKDGVISGDKFVSKVVFYLWNDVFKDYGFEDASLFRYETVVDGKSTEKDLTFPDFYDEEGENINADRLVDFLEKVLAWQKPEDNA